MQYHLGLVCACCLDYFMTSAEAMHVDMPISVNPQLVAMMRMTGVKRSMRMMTTVTKVTSLYLKRTSLPDQLYIGVHASSYILAVSIL